jgi:hypothetical protein
VLYELGADLDSREEHGATPAYVAASRNFVAALYLLAELQADVELPTSDGIVAARACVYFVNIYLYIYIYIVYFIPPRFLHFLSLGCFFL